MAIFNMFHRPKPKKFGFIPRHYDPEKEARDARLAQYKSGDNDIGSMKTRISSGLRSRRDIDSLEIRKRARRSNWILIASLLGLLLLLYIAINQYLPNLVNMIEK
jgi:hypothetical protein